LHKESNKLCFQKNVQCDLRTMLESGVYANKIEAMIVNNTKNKFRRRKFFAVPLFFLK